jgi:release factor glutamine methyltransferase
MNRSSTTVSDLIREGTRALRVSGSESPGLDAEILLREALNATREQLFDALPYPIQANAAQTYRELIARRTQGVPVAYIVGRREFYGCSFIVNEHVLVPRPETEYLVKRSLSWLNDHGSYPCRIVDVGTGSGAVAISVALEASRGHIVVGSDVSSKALAVALANRDALGATVEFVEGSLLDWCTDPVHVITANLPYLRPDQAHPGIEHEPAIALFAGEDGFALNRSLIKQAGTLLASPGLLIMELDPAQSELALDTARSEFTDAQSTTKADLAGLNRYLVVERS